MAITTRVHWLLITRHKLINALAWNASLFNFSDNSQYERTFHVAMFSTPGTAYDRAGISVSLCANKPKLSCWSIMDGRFLSATTENN